MSPSDVQLISVYRGKTYASYFDSDNEAVVIEETEEDEESTEGEISAEEDTSTEEDVSDRSGSCTADNPTADDCFCLANSQCPYRIGYSLMSFDWNG